MLNPYHVSLVACFHVGILASPGGERNPQPSYGAGIGLAAANVIVTKPDFVWLTILLFAYLDQIKAQKHWACRWCVCDNLELSVEDMAMERRVTHDCPGSHLSDGWKTMDIHLLSINHIDRIWKGNCWPCCDRHHFLMLWLQTSKTAILHWWLLLWISLARG